MEIDYANCPPPLPVSLPQLTLSLTAASQELLPGAKLVKRAPQYLKYADAPNEQYVAYWTLEPGWHTDIELRNNLKVRDLPVTPIIRATSGREMLPTVTVKPDEVYVLNLHEALAQAAPNLVQLCLPPRKENNE